MNRDSGAPPPPSPFGDRTCVSLRDICKQRVCRLRVAYCATLISPARAHSTQQCASTGLTDGDEAADGACDCWHQYQLRRRRMHARVRTFLWLCVASLRLLQMPLLPLATTPMPTMVWTPTAQAWAGFGAAR